MEKTKGQSKKPLRSIISLKDIPPLDPSSIPRNPSSMAKERSEEKKFYWVEEEEDNLMASSMISNIQIDPNSTRRRRSQQNPKPEEEDTSKPKPKDESMKGSAKSMLNEICTSSSKRWKPPLYHCCKVEGPSHLRLFTYKVVVEIRDFSGTTTTVLECFGDPKLKKKAAAEHAAEAALWYLRTAEKGLF